MHAHPISIPRSMQAVAQANHRGLLARAESVGACPRPTMHSGLARLTPREWEVLALITARYTDREIADQLFISYRTVTTHVSSIFNKLAVGSRREAAALAIQSPCE